MKLLTERLKSVKRNGIKKIPMSVAVSMPAKVVMPMARRLAEPCPCREHQRQDAEEEAPGRHHHRAEADGGALLGGFNDREPGLTSCFREFDHQNGVLASQADEHHHAELRVNRHIAAGEFEPQKGLP